MRKFCCFVQRMTASTTPQATRYLNLCCFDSFEFKLLCCGGAFVRYAPYPAAQCTHFGAPLASGSFVGNRVVCPWHCASFCVKTGDIEDSPALVGSFCLRRRFISDNHPVFVMDTMLGCVEDVRCSCGRQQSGGFCAKSVSRWFSPRSNAVHARSRHGSPYLCDYWRWCCWRCRCANPSRGVVVSTS
jgi:hypothetical protein